MVEKQLVARQAGWQGQISESEEMQIEGVEKRLTKAKEKKRGNVWRENIISAVIHMEETTLSNIMICAVVKQGRNPYRRKEDVREFIVVGSIKKRKREKKKNTGRKREIS